MSPGPYLNTGVFSTRVTDNDTTPQEALGVWRFEAGKILRYVKSAALIPRYEAVRFDEAATATAALFGNQVRATSGETDILLGIADSATFANLSYGWITCHGQATARVITNTIPGARLAPGGSTGVLLTTQITTYMLPKAIAVQTGLSAGSAIWVTAL